MSKTLPDQFTQFTKWRFSKKALAEIRQETFVQALQDKEAPMSVEEAKMLVMFYARTLLRSGMFSYTVLATAAVYLKRFFLFRSIMDYDPKEILLTCAFLASKTENQMSSLDRFCSKVKVNKDVIVESEYLVADGLSYHFAVFHPYLPLHGIFLDIQSTWDNMDAIRQLYKDSIEIATESLITDCCFIYQPAQIAMAIFQLVSERRDVDFEAIYLRPKFGDAVEKLKALLTEIRTSLDVELLAFKSVDGKALSEKLKAWRAK